MAFDYSKLRGKIREKFKTQARFANSMGFSGGTLSTKLNNAAEFTQHEIKRACLLLSIGQAEISLYFFTRKV